MTRTKEQIQRANLRKTLSNLKIRVAEKEKLWLELFQDFASVLLGRLEVESSNDLHKLQVNLAANLASVALDEYENRWGEG